MESREQGVFGRLPRRRPALRSALRERRQVDASPPPHAEGPRTRPEPAAAAGSAHDSSGHNPVEDIALAGIEAATNLIVLGIKLSGRAFGVVNRR